MQILGIDPGISGALAVINIDEEFNYPFRVVDIVDVPTRRNPLKKKVEIATDLLAERLDLYRPDLVVIESVHAMPGNGVVSMFRFGEALGQIKGAVAGVYGPSGHTYRELFPTPSVWKLKMGVTACKATTLQRATKETEHTGFKYFTRQKDHNRAEALLLALYGARWISTFGAV